MTRLPQEQQQSGPELWITGLGTQYPEHRLRPEDLEGLASRHCDLQTEGIKKLLAINLNTGIQTRASVLDFKQGFATGPEAPTIQDLDSHFREVGVDLAVQACQKALLEAAISPAEVTHSVAVTCTSQGNPGYNLLVHKRLVLRADVDHTLLHGVGCAGGLSIMRVAAQMALASTARGRPARVLAFACELCTPLVRSELAAAEDGAAEGVSVAATLFSDGAAAFVLTNGMGKGKREAKFQLRAFGNETLPGTMGHMSFFVDGLGARAVLGREIPHCASKAVKKKFDKLSPEYSESCSLATLEPGDFDWALHPGGKAIVDGVQRSMALSDEHLRASREVYRTRGNSSSPTVLIVLDMLRSLHTGGRQHIVAASFGPGMVIEMAMLRRCGVHE